MYVDGCAVELSSLVFKQSFLSSLFPYPSFLNLFNLLGSHPPPTKTLALKWMRLEGWLSSYENSSSQLCDSWIPGNPIPSGLLGHCTHMVQLYTHTLIHAS